MEDYYNLLAEAYEAEDLFWKRKFEESWYGSGNY